jgi:hypothetical protein
LLFPFFKKQTTILGWILILILALALFLVILLIIGICCCCCRCRKKRREREKRYYEDIERRQNLERRERLRKEKPRTPQERIPSLYQNSAAASPEPKKKEGWFKKKFGKKKNKQNSDSTPLRSNDNNAPVSQTVYASSNSNPFSASDI